MLTNNKSYGKQKFAAVFPLLIVIAAALIWSGFATFQHAEGPHVPAAVAWTLIVALDGTVVVTTPVWLSTQLPSAVRNYAAVICMGALVGSMFINFSETGLPGIFPPLIAGALIHLVGVVLRSYHRLEQRLGAESVDMESAVEPAAVEPVADAPALVPLKKAEPRPEAPSVRPVSLVRRSPKSAAVVAAGMLDAAYAQGKSLPGGAEITAACISAGFQVNENYGRSFKSRWMRKHTGAREAVAV